MDDQHAILAAIREAFGANQYPGDRWLLGSDEGCEPHDAVHPFTSHHDWTAIDAAFLDAHYTALSFFSHAGLRFFLPAYLVADVRAELMTADPVFHLTHGFFDFAVDVPVKGRVFRRSVGGSRLMGPRRFGAMTFRDHFRARLSVFTREEAGAIATYLQHKKRGGSMSGPAIDAALDAYWHERARSAPTSADLAQHMTEEAGLLEVVTGVTDATEPSS